MRSHEVHSGVNCPGAHVSEGTRSVAWQKSQKLPVYHPQSTQGRHSVSTSPTAETRIVGAGMEYGRPGRGAPH